MRHEESGDSGTHEDDNHWIGKICNIRGDNSENVSIFFDYVSLMAYTLIRCGLKYNGTGHHKRWQR